MTGAAYPAVTDDVVRSYQFFLPPIDEQQRIVERLEAQLAAVEQARAAAQAELAAAEAIPSSLLRIAFPHGRD